MEQERQYMNLKEVAEYLKVSKPTIYRLVHARKIPFIPLSSKALRFSTPAIDKWMERKQVKTIQDHLM